MARHRARLGPSYYESSSGSISTGGELEFKRTSFIRKVISRDDGHIVSILGAFDSRKKIFKEIPPRDAIHDIDPHAFPN